MNKDKTRLKILSAAKSEFIKNGFYKTSLRKIASLAGVTTGAIYGYFPDKEALFNEIVKYVAENFYNLYKDIQNDFQNKDIKKQKELMPDYTKNAVRVLVENIYKNFDEFKLIVSLSKGTKYENYVHELLKIEEEQTIKFLDVMEKNGKLKYRPSKELIHILCSGLINGIFEIVAHNMKKENAIEYMDKMNLYHTAGWYRIIFEL